MSCLVLFCSCVCFSVLLALRLPRMGKRELIYSAFRTFVRFVLVWFCRFPFPLDVWEGLRFVIVAFPGLFSYPPPPSTFFSPFFSLFFTLCCFVAYSTSRFVLSLITSLGEEGANLSVFLTSVRFALVGFCLFPLLFRVCEGLQLVVVALSGFFFYIFTFRPTFCFIIVFAIIYVSL